MKNLFLGLSLVTGLFTLAHAEEAPLIHNGMYRSSLAPVCIIDVVQSPDRYSLYVRISTAPNPDGSVCTYGDSPVWSGISLNMTLGSEDLCGNFPCYHHKNGAFWVIDSDTLSFSAPESYSGPTLLIREKQKM